MPDAASPWRGFERGVIECNGCGYATPDDLARRGRIQKCGQCSKVLYIPSGLYRSNYTYTRSAYNESGSVWWWVKDRIGAKLNRFAHSKARLPVALLIIVLGMGLLLGLNYFKAQGQKVPEKPSELEIYYNRVLAINKSLKTAEDEYDKGVGGAPVSVSDYSNQISPNNKTRFVRATDRILRQVETLLSDVYGMDRVIPAGAEVHYARLKAKLEERQRYYARLKDGVEQKSEDRWKEAFNNAYLVRETTISEEQALNQMQSQVLKPQTITPKS